VYFLGCKTFVLETSLQTSGKTPLGSSSGVTKKRSLAKKRHASKIMKTLNPIKLPNEAARRIIGVVCAVAILMLAYSATYAQDQGQAAGDEAPPIPAGELDSLVAPIALYPDTMLAQTLAASTYPLEVMQLDQWMKKNANLKDKALADAVATQPWDPSVQAMAAFPDVVTRMAENIQWMTDMGNAFLAQQKDVMDAVQRMRAKAQGTGNLKTGAETKVETQTTSGGQQVIEIEQTNPQYVYVPSYDPATVYGPPPAEHPYYPYSYPGYQPGTALAWGTAVVVGGAWANNWGNCDWDDANVTVNNNNNFNKNSTKNVNRGTGQGSGWQHNPQHRGNAPYANKQTANKYGGTARGESRTAGAGGGTRTGADARAGGANAGAGNRASGAGGQARDAGNRASGAGAQARDTGNRPGGGERSGGGAGNREPGGGGGAKAATRSGGGGGNSVGNRNVSSGPSGNAFGGGGGNGPSARAASSRGSASMKAGGGGGGRGGGGGGRGGGGRRR
jgi:hypothetical protein